MATIGYAISIERAHHQMPLHTSSFNPVFLPVLALSPYPLSYLTSLMNAKLKTPSNVSSKKIFHVS
jgi:hypothetical protein